MSDSRRVLLVGGRGWIGSALQDVLRQSRTPHLVTTSTESISRCSDVLKQVQDFKANAVVFAAGVTPDRGALLGSGLYQSALRMVQDELEVVTSLTGVRHFTYLSSGIADSPPDSMGNLFKEAYRQSKIQGEKLIVALPPEVTTLTVRIFSLSGPYVRQPRRYAIYDLITQCLAGRVEIKSELFVRRSYVSVMDLAKAVDHSSTLGFGGMKFTGGEPIELAELAIRVAEALNPEAEISVRAGRDGVDDYVGPDTQWRHWCRDVGVQPLELSAQIFTSAQWVHAIANPE